MHENEFEVLIKKLADELPDFYFMEESLTGRKISYLEFQDQIKAYSEKLKAKGVLPEDRVLIKMGNSIDFAIAYFAIAFCHGVSVPVNTALKEKELDYIINDTGSRLLVSEDSIHEIRQSGAQSGANCKTEGTEQDHAKLESGSDPRTILDTETAMLLYTSGTTGNPKGVILSYSNLLSKTRDIIEAHEFTDRDIVLCVLPWFHINGLVITLLTPMVSRQKIIIGGKFSVRRFWTDVEKYSATWFSGVPTMYSHMLSRGIPEYGTHSSLRFARSASSALPEAVLKDFESKTGVPVIESYGITEGSAQITSNPMPPKIHKPGSVGLSFGNSIKIMLSNGNEAGTNESGEVWIKGKNVTKGYYRKKDETEKAFTGEWFHSGDIGYLDSDGYLFLKGRIKELINRAGEKFSPLEIDEAVYQLPEVELAAAVGVPDPVYGEEAAVFIKLKEGCTLTKDQVTEHCKTQVADYKVPRHVFFVDNLPQGGNGKIQRLKLIDVFNSMI
ncbi:MAG: AMP-binding protein [Lachnospiraceae bacterium]|nr:AMP-binding protein [Lachnospiraceae bacterium]